MIETSHKVAQTKQLLDNMVPEELRQVLGHIDSNNLVSKSKEEPFLTESLYTVDMKIVFPHWAYGHWTRLFAFRTQQERDDFYKYAVETLSKFIKYRNVADAANIVCRTFNGVTKSFVESTCNDTIRFIPGLLTHIFSDIRDKLTEEESHVIDSLFS